jgi:hypothetical protein
MPVNLQFINVLVDFNYCVVHQSLSCRIWIIILVLSFALFFILEILSRGPLRGVLFFREHFCQVVPVELFRPGLYLRGDRLLEGRILSHDFRVLVNHLLLGVLPSKAKGVIVLETLGGNTSVELLLAVHFI